MRKSTSDRMNDYYAVVMGIFEPILVLSVIYEERLRLLDIANGYRNGYRDDDCQSGRPALLDRGYGSRRSIICQCNGAPSEPPRGESKLGRRGGFYEYTP